MGRFKAMTGAACAAVLLSAAITGAQGIVPDRSTFVTISAPVSLPGAVLPAGTYLFRLADTQASRNVIQIFDKDRSKIFATLITVSAERNEPSEDAVITFRESAAEQPPALRYWYYAGEKSGQEFVYPKDQAMMIAKTSGESVLAIDTTSSDAEQMRTGEITRVDAAAAAAEPSAPQPAATPSPTEQPEPAPAAQTAAPAPPAEPAPAQPTEPAPAQPAEPARPAAPVTPQAQAETPAPAATTGSVAAAPQPTGTSGRAAEMRSDAARELPRTASKLPLVTLFGFIALGAYFGARALRRGMIV